MILNELDYRKNTQYLYEGLDRKYHKSLFLWESAGFKLVEANLTLQQVQQIFQQVEQGATAAGSNRTVVGKGKDAASAVNQAWEDLKTKVQNSGPIKNVDALYDQAAEKLKQATGGDQGVMRYVQKYRDFAKKHPIAQSLIYSALIAAAGISGAGLGGAAALGLFKMTDKLLQGEKFSSAAYQGAKTGALAYGASKAGEYIKDKLAGNQAPSNASNAPSRDTVSTTTSQYRIANQPVIPGEPLSDTQMAVMKMGLDTGNTYPPEIMAQYNSQLGSAAKTAAQTATGSEYNDWSSAAQKADSAANAASVNATNPDGTASAAMKRYMDADAAQQAAYGKIPAQSAPAVDTTSAVDKASSAAANAVEPPADISTPEVAPMTQDEFDARKREISARINQEMAGEPYRARSRALYNDPEFKKLKADFEASQGATKLDPEKARNMAASMDIASILHSGSALSEAQVYRLFSVVDGITPTALVMEGPMDAVKGAINKGITSLKTAGHNLTTKVTADKLLSAWKADGSKLDDVSVANVIRNAGVSDQVLAAAFKAVKLKTPSAPSSTTSLGNTTTQKSTPYKDVVALINQLDKKNKQRLVTFMQKQLGLQP